MPNALVHLIWVLTLQNVTAGTSERYQSNTRLSTCLQEAYSLLAQSATAHRHMCAHTHAHTHTHRKSFSLEMHVKNWEHKYQSAIERQPPPQLSGKESTCNAGDVVRSLGREDPLEEKMAPHSSVLAWKMPWTEEPGGLQSMGLQRVRHDLMAK